jgi:P4 family phage/plasmid primase-like protien
MAQNYKRGEFCNYITRFKVEKGSVFSHTGIIKPSGAFYIPADEIDKFFDVYKRAWIAGEDLYMTEKHRDISPILIDLDFRFEKTEEAINKLERKYSKEDIMFIVQIYCKDITKYIESSSEIDIYVLEKPYPVVDKGLIKDGVHIIIPSIVTKPSVQYLIRDNIMKELKPIFDKIKCINPVVDIVDEAVIERNNWQMYGSKKPNCEAYKVTQVYKWCQTSSTLTEVNLDESNEAELIETLSIRNKYDVSNLKIEKINEVKEYEQKILDAKKKRKEIHNPIMQSSYNNKKNVIDNLEHVSKIVDILSEQRANSYQEWIRVGWCLRNIDYRLCNKWIDFSMKSSKFVDGECEKLWNYMRDDGLGIGTLYMWAKQDNPEEFRAIIDTDISNLIYTSRNETHYDIARVVHFMFKHQYVCASIKTNYWYEFREHRWVPCDSGYTLNSKLSTDVFKKYSAVASTYYAKAAGTDNDTEQTLYTEVAKKLAGIATKLKMVSYKENVMSECKRLFHIEKFEEKLDSKCHLIGFDNGVYDLELKEFRDGRPEDYISFATGCNYIPYDNNHPFSKQIDTFLSQVLTKKHIKEYVLLLLSSFLNGNIREERFHIWTGSGSNGKSVLIDLFEQSFGDYCCKFPVTLLTQKRAASNAASSELARAKGKRFSVLQEPSEDEKLNVGLMKELSGGDKIQARALFREPIEFKPQFKMVLTCNHLPNVPSDDGGTWRRIRLVEFTSKFTSHPNPEKENEFPIDTDLSSRFNDWKEHFMSLLIEYYKKYIVEGIKEPEEVLKCTKEYQKNNDFYLEFIESELENVDMSFLSVNDAYSVFKGWVKDNVPSLKIKKKDFTLALDKTCGKRIVANRVEGWKGYRVKTYNGGDFANEDDDL